MGADELEKESKLTITNEQKVVYFVPPCTTVSNMPSYISSVITQLSGGS